MKNKNNNKKIVPFPKKMVQSQPSQDFINHTKDTFDFEKGFIIHQSKKIEVEKRNILGAFDMFLPKDFQIMDDELIRIKYPNYHSTNKIVFTTEDTTVNITFDIQNIFVTVGDLPVICKASSASILDFYSTANILEMRTNKEGNSTFSYLTCVIPSADYPIYNFTSYFCIHGYLIVGNCNCFHRDMHDWQILFKKILETVQPSKRKFYM